MVQTSIVEAVSREKWKAADVVCLIDIISQTQYPSSVFLSKKWILSWLASISTPTELIVFYCEQKEVGFAFLGKQTHWYGDTYYLNQTGDPIEDQMWIEQNDIISNPLFTSKCREALLVFLSTRSNFHRLVLSLVSSDDWCNNQVFTWSFEATPVSFVCLSSLSQKSLGFETTLSKNSRSNIKRAGIFIEKQIGAIEMNVHRESLDAIFKHEELAQLHINQWADTVHGSGFQNNVFMAFICQLCDGYESDIECEIISFKAGKQSLGYLLNFIYDKKVYFYLSAINYSVADNKYKPGLVMHKMAIEHYLSKGYQSYDFLAGQARYKKSLSTDTYNLYSIHLASKKPVHKLLFKVNQLKQMSLSFMDKMVKRFR